MSTGASTSGETIRRGRRRPPPAMPARRAGERELVARLLAGDEAAFTDLVRRTHGPMVRLARVFVSSRAVAEEVVQETWLAVLRGLPDFEGRSSLKTWIFRILTNRAKTRGVRDGRQVPFSALAPADADAGEAVDPSRFDGRGHWTRRPRRFDDDTPEKLLSRRETRDLLQAAIDKLPPNQRAVLVLRDVEGWTSQDVCHILQVSEVNQRVLLHRARTRVRRLLEDLVGAQ